MDEVVGMWSFFEVEARSRRNRCAISSEKGDLTFGELFSLADDLAAALAGESVKEGRTVGLALPNGIAFVPSFLALLKMSAPVALVSSKYKMSAWEAINEGIRPQCVLTAPGLAGPLARTLGADRTKTLTLPGLGEEIVLVFPPSSGAPADPAGGETKEPGFLPRHPVLIKFTSGSTGEPKGIAWTAENVEAEARNVASTLELTSDDRILAGVPLYHSYGFDLGVLAMLLAGSTLVIRDVFIPRRVTADLTNRRATVFLGVPSIYRLLLEIPPESPPDWRHVRYLLSCTAPLPVETILRFHDAYGCPICQHYGSSETGAATTHIPSEVLDRPESVGVAMKNVEITVVDESGNAAASGEDGEVVIRSRAVSAGYVMGRPPGPSGFRDGSYWTGDVGAIDERGFLSLKGRLDDMINIGGFKVFPGEVVRILERYPAVNEAAATGIQDARGENAVYAAVTLESPATEEEILAFCRRHLANYKVPRRLDILDELPTGPTGKIRLRPEDVL